MIGPATMRRCRSAAIAALAAMLVLAGSSGERAEEPESRPAQRAAGLLAEPRRAGQNQGGLAGGARQGPDGDVHGRRARHPGRHRNALQVSWSCIYDEEPNAKGAKGSDSASKQIRRIEAKGGVTVTQKEQNASGDSGIFDMRANTVTLVGKRDRDARHRRPARPAAARRPRHRRDQDGPGTGRRPVSAQLTQF